MAEQLGTERPQDCSRPALLYIVAFRFSFAHAYRPFACELVPESEANWFLSLNDLAYSLHNPLSGSIFVQNCVIDQSVLSVVASLHN